MTSRSSHRTGRELDAARHDILLSTDELWLRYFALGGTVSAPGLTEYLVGGAAFDVTEHDILVHAVNERYSELGLDHPFPYRSDSRPMGEGPA